MLTKILTGLRLFFLVPLFLGVACGTTASFSIAATGVAPFSYQWRRNGVAIPGATSSGYEVTEPGSYDCVVRDAAGIETIVTDPSYTNPVTFEAVAPTATDYHGANDGSMVPDLSGAAGGEAMWCMPGATNWQTGPLGGTPMAPPPPGPNGPYREFYVATKCADGYTGNSFDPIQGWMMVNTTPAKAYLW